MTNAELASLLNSKLGLAGGTAITPNIVRQWVAWDVLSKATAHGLGHARGLSWGRSHRDMKRALRLAQWRAVDVRRETSVIVHAFVAWGHPDIDRVRTSLIAEVARAGTQLRGKIRTNLSFDDFSHLDATRKKAFRTQLGPLDERFKGTQFELSSELYALIGQLTFMGTGDIHSTARVLNAAVQPYGLPTEYVKLLSLILVDGHKGLFGSAEELGDSAETLLLDTTDRDLCIARDFLRLLDKGLRHINAAAMPPMQQALFAKLQSIYSEINHGNWLVSGLALAAKLSNAQLLPTISQVEGELTINSVA